MHGENQGTTGATGVVFATLRRSCSVWRLELRLRPPQTRGEIHDRPRESMIFTTAVPVCLLSCSLACCCYCCCSSTTTGLKFTSQIRRIMASTHHTAAARSLDLKSPPLRVFRYESNATRRVPQSSSLPPATLFRVVFIVVAVAVAAAAALAPAAVSGYCRFPDNPKCVSIAALITCVTCPLMCLLRFLHHHTVLTHWTAATHF